MKENKFIEKILGDICINDDYGVVMRKWRNLFNVSQAELAEKLDIQPSVISDYESGRRNSPGIVFIRKYVLALINIGKNKNKKILDKLSGYPFDKKNNLIVKKFDKKIKAEDFISNIDARIVIKSEEFHIKKCIFFYNNITDTFASMSTKELLSLMKGRDSVLIFSNVKSGRFPFIVLRLLSGANKISLPKFVIFQGTDSVSKMVLRMAHKSNICLALTKESKENIKDKIHNIL